MGIKKAKTTGKPVDGAECRACGKFKPHAQFNPGFNSCIDCAPVAEYDAIVNLTWENWSRKAAIAQVTRAGRTAKRRADRLAEHARLGGKRCGACWHRLPVDHYSALATSGDGLQPVCKRCNATQSALRKNSPLGQARQAWYAYRDAMRALPSAVAPDPSDTRQIIRRPEYQARIKNGL